NPQAIFFRRRHQPRARQDQAGKASTGDGAHISHEKQRLDAPAVASIGRATRMSQPRVPTSLSPLLRRENLDSGTAQKKYFLSKPRRNWQARAAYLAGATKSSSPLTERF